MEEAARPLGVERAPTLVSMLDWILPVGVGSNSHVNSSLLTFAELRRANTRSLGSIGETADVVFSFALALAFTRDTFVPRAASFRRARASSAQVSESPRV